MGVFATRAPNRPNPIGLSLVEIVSVTPDTPNGPVIEVKGAALMDGTPILDIKPYITYADSRPDAVSGFASDVVKVDKAASQKLNRRDLKARVAARLYFCLEGVEALRAFFACPFDYDCGLHVVAGVYKKALE